jgi:hypothetical protein
MFGVVIIVAHPCYKRPGVYHTYKTFTTKEEAMEFTKKEFTDYLRLHDYYLETSKTWDKFRDGIYSDNYMDNSPFSYSLFNGTDWECMELDMDDIYLELREAILNKIESKTDG